MLRKLLMVSGPVCPGARQRVGRRRRTSSRVCHRRRKSRRCPQPGAVVSRRTSTRRTKTISFELSYENLVLAEPPLFAHIHVGQRGVNGGVSVFLCGPPENAAQTCPTAPATVVGELTPANIVGPVPQGIDPATDVDNGFHELVALLRSGRTYANVHSSHIPGRRDSRTNQDGQPVTRRHEELRENAAADDRRHPPESCETMIDSRPYTQTLEDQERSFDSWRRNAPCSAAPGAWSCMASCCRCTLAQTGRPLERLDRRCNRLRLPRRHADGWRTGGAGRAWPAQFVNGWSAGVWGSTVDLNGDGRTGYELDLHADARVVAASGLDRDARRDSLRIPADDGGARLRLRRAERLALVPATRDGERSRGRRTRRAIAMGPSTRTGDRVRTHIPAAARSALVRLRGRGPLRPARPRRRRLYVLERRSHLHVGFAAGRRRSHRRR